MTESPLKGDLAATVHAQRKLLEIGATNVLRRYSPYPFQRRFHAARNLNGDPAMQRLLMAGNQVGKTLGGAAEASVHATGMYDDLTFPWEGIRITAPRLIWCGGQNNDKVRDICQRALLGEPGDPEALGTGLIPKDRIISTTRKPGIPNAFDSVIVRHANGKNVKIAFKSYEAGKADWMGEPVDVIWLDEEPPADIYSQALARVVARNGLIYMTFTPENGVTATVHQFMNDLKPGQMLYTAGWEDAPHLTKELCDQLLAAMLPHERKMRSRGIPTLGSGMVFPIAEEDITIEPRPMPHFWPRLCGMDFGGWDHPTAMVWGAWDRESDVICLYDCHKAAQQLPAVNAAAIKARGEWIPVCWPHDGLQKDKGSGEALAYQYRELGVNMLPEHFTNEDGSIAVEPGLLEMFQRMETGRLKVFSTLAPWFEEMRMYHRKDGILVKQFDDLMSASRYLVQGRRFATTQIIAPLPDRAEGTLEDWDPFS